MVERLREVRRRWRLRRHPRIEWPATNARPRVLLESPSSATPSAAADVLRTAGCEPLVCSGPGDTKGICWLLETGACSMAGEADVVYNAFGLGTDEHRSIIRALRDRYPDTPVVVETSRPSAEEHAELVRGCVVSKLPVGAHTMVAAVQTAMARR